MISDLLSCALGVLPLVLLPGLIEVGAKVFPTHISPRVISTQYGKMRGVVVNLPNKNLRPVDAYLGLQYASVLGGDLRFMPPTSPMEKWDGIRVALKFRAVCPQKLPNEKELEAKVPKGRVEHFKRLLPFLERQDEECLNLNIYVPVRDANETEPLPVIVYIHGESYELGTGNAYDGSVLASFGNVVVVTLNYRLGVLGFLSTGDSNAPGNYALLDQVAALHWIKENIAAFGGDPLSVTLMGQGYGAAMVNLLLISPVTKGKSLFKRAIIQSGSALSSWAISLDPLRYTKELSEKVNCSQHWGKSINLLRCFKSKSAKEISNVAIKAPKYFSAFGPVIDKRSVLPKGVRNLMDKSQSVFGSTNVLMGTMKNEGFIFFNEKEIRNGVSVHKRDRMIRTYVRNIYQYHRQKIFEILLHHYSDWDTDRTADPKIIRDKVMELLGDGQFISPMIELTKYHANYAASTYMYSFSYPSRLDAYPRWAGGVHGDDLLYVLGASLTDGIDPFPTAYTRSEKMLSEAVMRFWTNFAKSGDPNKPMKQSSVHGGRVKNRFVNLNWPIYENGKEEYLHIGMRPTIRHHYRGSKMALWLDLIPKLHKSDNLDARHHLLLNYNNMSTFEKDGTKKLDMKKIFPPATVAPPIQPPRYQPTTSSPKPSTKKHSSTVLTSTFLPTDPNKPTRRPRTTSILNPTYLNKHRSSTTRWHRTTTPTFQFPNITGSNIQNLASVSDGKDNTLSLSVTIAVGCSLLFLNILIFAGVYYQKDRMRIERKARQREMDKEQSERLQENENIKNIAQDTDTNSSSMATPPVGHSIPRHQVQPQEGTLTKHPIPVMPPQAPFRQHGCHSPVARDYLRHHHHTSPHNTSPSNRSLRHLDREYTDLKHSSSADSGTDVNNHHSNPVTVV